MVTQLLFGETFTIINKTNRWAQIITSTDNYSCWINDKQYKSLTTSQFTYINANSFFLVADVISVIEDKLSNLHFPVVAGSVLPCFEEDNFEILNEKYNYEGEVVKKDILQNGKAIVNKAIEFLNAPYLWGGKSILGIDCSGFTQLVYRLNGINLLRDAYQQAEQGVALSFLEESKPGDLAFFDNEEGKIIHVGILMGNNKIIHASGKVRIDSIDHYGIFNQEINDYTHHLRLLKKYLA
jgi:hypothetical protein